MSILDSTLLFSGTVAAAASAGGALTGQAVTATAISTNVLDLGPVTSNTLRNIGAGKPLYLVILTTVAVTRAAGAATVTFSLESDSTADLATSATVHWTSAAIAKATLIAGYRVCAIAIPSEKLYEQYLGLRYTVSATLDTGSFVAFLTPDPQNIDVYAKGYTIS